MSLSHKGQFFMQLSFFAKFRDPSLGHCDISFSRTLVELDNRRIANIWRREEVGN